MGALREDQAWSVLEGSFPVRVRGTRVVFAAAAPICGGADLELLNNAVGVPFWIFHGDSDRVVPVEKSRDAFKFLIKERDHHKYTEYKGVYHNSWNNVFEEEDYFKWLFSKSR